MEFRVTPNLFFFQMVTSESEQLHDQNTIEINPNDSASNLTNTS